MSRWLTPKISMLPASGSAKVEQAFDQRRLAGAVHADQAESLSWRTIAERIAQSVRRAIALADPFEAQSRAKSGAIVGIVKRWCVLKALAGATVRQISARCKPTSAPVIRANCGCDKPGYNPPRFHSDPALDTCDSLRRGIVRS